MEQFLYQKLDNASEMGFLDKTQPLFISKNLNPQFAIREYQKEAFARFFYYIKSYPQKKQPVHLLYNMATGSGKTFVMAGLMLYLYERGYRNFLFFVNSTNIIDKTKANFLDSNSSKYLFNDKISFDGKIVNIKEVSNFTTNQTDDIQIKFTTIQGLHTDLNTPKENGLTYEDFVDKKIVVLSDEAHHVNSTTKNGGLSKTEDEEKRSWEYTVLKILNSHLENIMLEFTATIDLSNEFVKEKYIDKIIYKYDLKEFRLDWYSKEVDILKSDMEQKDRIVQALILSQYRLKIAEKNKIYAKPVILFKAQKTVAESEENKKIFIKLIKELKIKDIQAIQTHSTEPIIKSAFRFFEENNISIDDLVRELQEDFGEDKCLSANDDKEAGKNQILLNTLEDKTNRIRAIFAVQKLNEGWDVLNLFDIVRLYESRSNVVDKKTGKIKVWPQTLSEAQLIGRWARYSPFTTNETLGEDKYKRKFDKTDHELKILETFYYHTSFDNLYITEIKQALREIWMMDEKEKKIFPLELKESFINTEFYKTWVIYTNERKEIWWEWINSLEKAGITTQRIPYSLMSWISDTIVVFDEENKQNNAKIAKEPRTILMKNIGKHIVRKAIWKNDFYKFDNLIQYLWELKSIDQFMADDKYLWNIKIDFNWTQETLDNIDNEQLLQAVSFVLKQLEAEIKWKEIRYRGTKQFKPNTIQKIFKKEKDLFVELWEEWFGVDEDWFVFEKIVWSSEEKAFVQLFEKKIQELQKKYEDIYLIRSERAFPIYSFDKWERFEPDFVLFMKDRSNKQPITYQVFIEPKWDHLLLVDKWKQDFLLEIDTNAEILDLNLGNYKLIGLPFYNRWLENEFEKAMDEKILG